MPRAAAYNENALARKTRRSGSHNTKNTTFGKFDAVYIHRRGVQFHYQTRAIAPREPRRSLLLRRVNKREARLVIAQSVAIKELALLFRKVRITRSASSSTVDIYLEQVCEGVDATIEYIYIGASGAAPLRFLFSSWHYMHPLIITLLQIRSGVSPRSCV